MGLLTFLLVRQILKVSRVLLMFSIPFFICFHLRDQLGATSLRYRNRARITVIICMNGSSIRYGFPTGAKAINPV